MEAFNGIYVMGSLRNKKIPGIGVDLRERGYEVFDDWYSGGYEADDKWQDYERERGRSYAEALYGPAARNVFEFDKRYLDVCSLGILVTPCGRSAHLELGYLLGRGTPAIVYFSDGEPERWDVMYQFASDVAFDIDELFNAIARNLGQGMGQCA